MKLVPKRRFKEFSGEWEEKKFEKIFEISQGLQIEISKRSTNPGKDMYFYITNEFLKSDSKTKYYVHNPPQSVICKKDDILMTRTGNTGIVVTNVEGCFHNNFFKIDYESRVHNKDFLCQYLSTPSMQNKILNSAGSSTIPDLSHKAFYKITGYFPIPEEQSVIALFVNRLSVLVRAHSNKLKKLQTMKQAYLHEMFPAEGESVPKRRFVGFKKPWKKQKIDDLGSTYGGLSGKTKNDFGKGNAEFIPYLNVFNNPVSDIHFTEHVEIDKSQNEVRFGDILFTTSSETPEEVGMSSVWLDNRENVYLNSFCFGYRLREDVDPFFMAYALRTVSVRNQFILLAQGISRYNISSRKAMHISINFPKLEEQQKIGSFFRKLDERIAMQKAKVEKLKAMKKAYLEEMFI